MNRWVRALGLLPLATMVTACSALEEHVLFMTKSNVGIDVDSKPPTAEISIARREAVLEPTFEGGKTPAVLASFRSAGTGIFGMFYNISATFAGGDAATTMTALYGDETAGPVKIESSSLCLSNQPKSKSAFRADKELGLGSSGEYRPFIFGTDTAFGLKAAWSGLTGYVPDTVRLGYNRKELAWAPIFVTNEPCAEDPRKPEITKPYKADVSSFLATIDHEGRMSSPDKSGFDHLQYFATGKAATNLSLRKEVRLAMLRKIDPDLLVTYTDRPDENSKCLATWLDADQTNPSKLRNWLNGQGITVKNTIFVTSAEHSSIRPKAITALSISCSKKEDR
ncbi:MAG: hypothetical protein OJF51_000219 [Nitrospira sp.]|nr:MAG: hypothetical protein OJF51_000219 [Nitrospira sp.]